MAAPFPHRYQIGLNWTGGKEGVLSAPPRPELSGGAPPEFDGTDRVWSPEHLLLSSASLCLMLTFLALADKTRLRVDGYRCRTEGVLEKTPTGIAFSSIRVLVELRADDQPRAEALLQTAKKHCIVSNSLKSPLAVEAVEELG